jgi:Beta-1,3-glucanase/Alpha-L-arabinofuranosidase B (ABFB) domain
MKEMLMFRTRWLITLLLSVTLLACGGGGGGQADPMPVANAEAAAAAQKAGDGVSLQTGQWVSFRVTTPGFTTRYLRHAFGNGFTEVINNSSSQQLKEDATFKVVPALDGTPCYSFESRNFPGRYLRHSGYRVRNHAFENNDLYKRDATFCVQQGFGSAAGALSFVSRNFPGHYLRHINGEVFIARLGGPNWFDAAGAFNDDISWSLQAGWAPPATGGEVLPPAPAGKINLRLLNATNGAHPDTQLYWAVIGYNPATNVLSYLNRSGQMMAASPADNDAANRLVKNGVSYANYFNRVSEAGTIQLPKMYGARLFLSIGSPMFIKVVGIPGGVGFAGPDINNPSDPNQDVYFDFAEFTYNDFGFFGNTTRVDQFGFPLRIRLVSFDGTDKTLGENTELSREAFFRDFDNLAQTEFRHLVRRPFRIVAPRAGDFATGRPLGNYFNGYVNQVWDHYRSRDLVVDTQSGTYRGRVQGEDFVFSKNGGPANIFIRGRPSSVGILEASGNLASGTSEELVIQAQIAAAFNRHLLITVDPSQWSDASTYYRTGPANFYSKFFHDRSIDGKAYGFSYDDVRDHSTLLQHPQPRQVDVQIGW